MNELKIFTNDEFGEIRTVVIDGEPWFVGKDVAVALGYTDTADAVRTHVDMEDKKHVKVGEIPTLKTSNYGAYLINESGIYALVFGSKLESATRFKRWVTKEVLPAIRKYGMYAKDELLDNPDLLLDVVQRYKSERDKRLELEKENARMKPKEIFADAVSASDSSILVRELAKIIKQNGVPLGERRFYTWLRENGYICKTGREPTQRAMELGLFEVIIRTVERGNGFPIETKTTKVTGKGQQYFINKFLDKERAAG